MRCSSTIRRRKQHLFGLLMVRAIFVLVAVSLGTALPFSAAVPPSRSTMRPNLVGAPLRIYAFNKDTDVGLFSGQRLQQLNKASTFASVLCAIDCTVFPLLIALQTAIGLGSGTLSSELLHKASHLCALYFVVPVGGTAVTTNFLGHRKPLVALWGCCGLFLVLLANLHLHFLPHSIEHALHAYHKLINIAGCALLLSSQWYSQRLLKKMGKCCDRDH